ncbi:MAG: serine/threonine-protein phosphatase [Lachnospiraceae bacterium]|nr:serine/threonine-protein phosphatase [Lachnospiraceae bacterium]
MIDFALMTNPGGRDNNEDYVTSATYGNAQCFILCDGLGGHDAGEVASRAVAEDVANLFRSRGDYPDFIRDAFNMAQENLLKLQQEKNMVNAMKTTMVVLVITEDIMKWGHIGDSRLYHIFAGNTKYERTRDHSMVQLLFDMGEITEKDMRHHEDRNKLLRVMGTEWSSKSFDLSGVLERGETHSFALMTDGFWEYVEEEEMLSLLNETPDAKAWMDAMAKLVVERADMTSTDNFSAICVKVD